METAADLQVHIAHDLVLVAEEDGRLIGTVRLVQQDRDTVWFTRFAVLPERQRGGVGHLLYQAALAAAQKRGCRFMLLHTALSNQNLVTFYQTRGFEQIDVSYERGYPARLFLKTLKAAPGGKPSSAQGKSPPNEPGPRQDPPSDQMMELTIRRTITSSCKTMKTSRQY
jgi:ribosomal protein S18 acetylase RimI-like enzyme